MYKRLVGFLGATEHHVHRELAARFLRWATTGCLTVALDVMLFKTLYPIVQSVLIANALGIPLVTGFNYWMHHKWSFRASRSHISASSRFIPATVVSYLLNSALVKLALVAGASPAVAKLTAVPVQAPISFLLLNGWVFHAAGLRGARPAADSQDDRASE